MGDGGVKNFKIWMGFEDFVADSLNKVSFTKTWSAVEKERIVTIAGRSDDIASCRDGKVVVGSDNKIV